MDTVLTAAPKRSWMPYVLLLLAGLVWGSTFSLARIATEGGAHPVGLAFWQAIGGSCILFCVCLGTRKWPQLHKTNMFRFMVIGLLGTALPGTLYFYAAKHLPAGILAITVALVPMMTYVATLVLRIDEFTVKRLLGVVCGFVAVMLLGTPEASPNREVIIWLVAAVICTISYTAENVYLDRTVPQGVDMTGLLMGGLLAAGLMLFPFVIALDAFVPLTLPFSKMEWAVIAMMVVSTAAYLMFLSIIQSSGAVFASLMGYVITLSGVAWGIWTFDEQHSAIIWVALGLMLIGMGLVKPRKKHV